GGWNPMSVGVRTAGDAATIAPLVREAARAVDPQLPLGTVRSVEELIAGSLGERRFGATLLAVFAWIAVVLAAVGLYGAISFAVGRRTREIGVRVALRARPAGIVRVGLRGGVRVARL